MPLTLDDIRSIVREVTADTVEAAVAPLREKQTSIAAQMTSAAAHETLASSPEKGLGAARIIRALASQKGDPEKAAAFARKTWGDDAVAKALSASDSSAGGFMIPDQFSDEVIEFLRPATVVRRLGPVVLPMPQGTLRIPRLSGGATASYIGENQNLPNTAPSFGQVTLTWKKLAAIIPISNDLLRFTSPGADTIIRDDLVRAMAQAEDLAFIRADGSADQPKGLRYWAPTATNVLTSAGSTLANVISDLSSMILALKNANVRFIKPGWIMTPRTEQSLMTLQNSQGFYVFRQEMLSGMLWKYPYLTTTQIPTNLGGGSNTEIYFTDFADAVIGEANQLIVDASTEAAYYDGSQLQAAFSMDQTVVRAIARHDFVMRHDLSAAVMTSVAY